MKNSKSVVFKRQQTILKELEEKRVIDVETLSIKLKVSQTTIRRDLQIFEKQGLVTRFHGGAQLIEGTLQEDDGTQAQFSRIQIDSDQKHIIASYAATLVNDGDTIFINSSSTTLLLLDYLRGKRVIVVTNNGNVLAYPKDSQIEIILTGGEVYKRKQSMVGEFALNTLSKISANKAFIGVGGISVESGITTAILPETAVNEMMMQRCDTCYVLAASNKIGKSHNFLSGSIKDVDTLITCKGGNQQELDKMRSLGVKIVELENKPLTKG